MCTYSAELLINYMYTESLTTDDILHKTICPITLMKWGQYVLILDQIIVAKGSRLI